jgi:F0F1-type ATP synthase assembly protein I
MKRTTAWFLSAAVLVGLVAGIYLLTLSANLVLT